MNLGDSQVAEPDNVYMLVSSQYDATFKGSKKEVLAMQGGTPLVYRDRYLCDAATGRAIGKLSQVMQEKLSKWEARAAAASASMDVMHPLNESMVSNVFIYSANMYMVQS